MSDSTKAVFISYASEDSEAAKRIADALRAFGVEVWFDQSELRGGDSWDAKIRKQIKECTLFLPVISARTEDRHEGYFRREWNLAVERMHDMAEGVSFLVPVVIDDTHESEALVPGIFRSVQWTRLPHGVPATDFVETVRALLEGRRLARQQSRAQPATLMSAQPSRRQRTGMPIWAWAAVAVVVVGGLAVALVNRTDSDLPATHSSPALSQSNGPLATAPAKSIAVLPLKNLSPDPANAFFADGVHEDILTDLSKIRELLVISRTSTLGYRDTTKNLKEIGRELGVRYVVEGSVRRAGDQVRVTVQLIDATNDEHLWAQNYDRKLDDIFAIQSAVAREIAGQLQAAISPEEAARIERRPTENLKAYEFYVKARQLIEVGGATRGDEKIALLEQAVALDPDFAEAWAQLVVESIYWWRVDRKQNDPVLLARAEEALANAERLAPDLANTYYARAMMAANRDSDLVGFARLMREALDADPSFDYARYWVATYLAMSGNLEEAQPHFEIVSRSNPSFVAANMGLVSVYLQRGLFDKARTLIRKNLDRSDNGIWRERLAETDYLQSGDKQAYVAAMKSIPSFADTPTGKLWLALQARDYQSALQVLGGKPQLRPREYNAGYFPDFDMRPASLVAALIWFERGDNARALTEVEETRGWIMEKGPLADDSYPPGLALCDAFAGDREQFKAHVALLRKVTQSDFYRIYQAPFEMAVATAQLVLGDNDAAIETLTRASKMEGGRFLGRELELWFIFDRLRGDPRFDALLSDDPTGP